MDYRRKFWKLVILIALLATVLGGFIGGALIHFVNKTLGTVVLFLIIGAAWLSYKRLSRAYQAGTLFNDQGKISSWSTIKEAAPEDDFVQDTSSKQLNYDQLSKKDRARLAEIERLRKEEGK
ncbi:hypothetical protein BSR29_02715 [Boudabousia liubingyangii]|uniref:Uncharacterized protein n=1 Tax=Boudabousia liubingyangii TaxID=1921764 RepID=A0A1Q5PMP3_9ACTO|nr:hypothetical protein [Boudabousia liubingyangii]OKL47418.1 hypothetical protein BSR28_02575 [Boudabousia liubingyangii]OKL48789.1 hypothetical protein BSR29_02715 [Boudabousia liubingyangii]